MAGILLEDLALWKSPQFSFAQILFSYLIVLIATILFTSKRRRIYLVDFACHKPPETGRLPCSTLVEHATVEYASDPKSVDFMRRILTRSGLGDETCVPPIVQYIPPVPTMEASREEAQLVIFSAIDSVLAKTGIKPKDINILVVNCGAFCPTPSLSAMVVNHYKMPSNIQSYNLSGMGCSAGLISIDLAQDLLQVYPNSYALVVSTEIITPIIYTGNQRSMLVANCLFRMGAGAVILSSRRSERKRAKYHLLHVVRTHTGSDDNAHNSVRMEEDKVGKLGVSLSKDLMVVAGKALKSNITTLAPLVLPFSEKLQYLFNVIAQKIYNPKMKPYVPNFKRAFQHFCIHAGGRGVIDEVEKNLRLSPENVEPSRMVLHRFGNTSSSTIWYELSYIEAKGRMKKGDHLWQISFGSGFKCNSAVWKCNRTIETPTDGPWSDCIHKYPVQIPAVLDI
ncbi:3-ketoacyl-CoA synthase 6-like [Tasmannia lanceolata]|uniref:3-ketoacyl-CoA synthase 6-like n=1 Tax=Tasmannia lanceolata TaxID=3420 RepID=UPI0040646A88